MQVMPRIGLYQERTVLQVLKNGAVADNKAISTNVTRLTNQIWKLIPMRENKEDWEKQLESVSLEIAGINGLIIDATLFQLLAKLEGLKTVETSFEVYRRTVFESISLLQEFGRGFRI